MPDTAARRKHSIGEQRQGLSSVCAAARAGLCTAELDQLFPLFAQAECYCMFVHTSVVTTREFGEEDVHRRIQGFNNSNAGSIDWLDLLPPLY